MTIKYNEAIKKLIHGFGELFNNITIHRETSSGFKPVKLPIHFAPASYDYTDILQHPNLIEVRPSLKLPLLTYEIVRYDIDTSRKENRYYSRNACIANANGTFNLIRSPTPYNVGINLYLFTHFLDDVFEVQERIYTGFNPKVTIRIKQDNGIITQVPITLQNVSKVDNYEGNPKENSRLISTTFTFETKMDFYMSRGETVDLIKKITMNYKDNAVTVATTEISVDPIEADITDDWSIKVEMKDDTPLNNIGVSGIGGYLPQILS